MDDQSTPVESLIERIKIYAETRIELLKLKAIDKSSSFVSLFISMLVVILFSFIFFVFLSIGLALLIGDMLGNTYYGFFIIAGFFLITGLVMFSLRDKWLKEPLSNTMIKKLLD